MQATFHDKTIDFDLIPGINEDDIAFLSGIYERFPRVAHGYAQFTQSPAGQRIPLAAQILQTQIRTGWKLRFEELPDRFRDILSTHAGEYYGSRMLMDEASQPSTESVLEHCAEAQELFMRLYRNYPKNHRQWGMECMKFHDFHEAIDGDFTPHCPITRDEKKRLEAISTRVLCEASQHGSLATLHVWNATQLFEGHVDDFEAMRTEMLRQIATQREQGLIKPHQAPAVEFFENLYANSRELNTHLLRTQVSDVDALHMAIRSCRMVKEGHIAPEHKEKMKEFWDYIEKKIQTPEAKTFYHAFREAYMDDKLSYQMAVTSAMNSVGQGRSI